MGILSPLSLFVDILLVSLVVSSEIATESVKSKSPGFVSDDILKEIVPRISKSWTFLKEELERRKGKYSGFEKDVFWHEILLKKLKPYHEAIREVDRVVLENSPSTTLNPIVNIPTINEIEKLSEKVQKKDKNLGWLDYVKEAWVSISSMVSQIHWKYNRVFDLAFEEGMTKWSELDVGSSLNDTIQLYHAWFRIVGRGEADEQYCLEMSELSNYSKTVATGTDGVEKNMFHGLRALLNHKGKPSDSSEDKNDTAQCVGNETFAGKSSEDNKFLPVYVLLHLLNAEFKYYIMKNVMYMHLCAHTRKCEDGISDMTEKHLRLYYEFYLDGITEAFAGQGITDDVASKIPKGAWRWRCDPPLINSTTPGVPPRRDHKEDATYTRMYDFETTFITDERNLSLTQTCRESCDMFDGSYSSIPCEEDHWSCLEQAKEFDCYERRNLGFKCPGPARKLCPNSGLKCRTTDIQTAEVCTGKTKNRYLEWIDTDVLKTLGKKSKCGGEDTVKMKYEEIMERSAITKHEPQQCELCLCKCFEPLGNDTHRYISLLEQTADTKNGYVLVGAKFLKKDSVVYPVLAEAKLVNGQPDNTTIRWTEPKAVNKSDDTQVFHLRRDARLILLDDFVSPKGYVITGIRFSRRFFPRAGDYQSDVTVKAHVVYVIADSDDQTWHYGFNNSEMGLEVQLTALNSEGVLNPTDSNWTSNLNDSTARNEVKLDDLDDPTLSELPSLPASSSNEFLVMQSSSVTKDAGQTPVPFFDTQELIEPEDLSPIRGLGIFYKGQPGFGGFLAFRMISLNGNSTQQNPRYDLWSHLKNNKRKTQEGSN